MLKEGNTNYVVKIFNPISKYKINHLFNRTNETHNIFGARRNKFKQLL